MPICSPTLLPTPHALVTIVLYFHLLIHYVSQFFVHNIDLLDQIHFFPGRVVMENHVPLYLTC